MSYKIEDIEGVGPAYAKKLASAKITTTGQLLKKCATPAGRKNVAKEAGMSESVVLKWSNMADLMRVNGIGSQFSELLNGAGVDTIKELRTRNAANLAAKMKEVNDRKNLTKAVPSEKTITKWIATAKKTKPMLTY